MVFQVKKIARFYVKPFSSHLFNAHPIHPWRMESENARFLLLGVIMVVVVVAVEVVVVLMPVIVVELVVVDEVVSGEH